MEAREKGILTNLLTWQTISDSQSEESICSLEIGKEFPSGYFTGVFGYTSQVKISAALNMSTMQAGTRLRLYKIAVRTAGEFNLKDPIDGSVLSMCYPVAKAVRLKLTECLSLEGNFREAISNKPELISKIFDLDWVSPCKAIAWEGVRDFGCGPVVLKFCTLRSISSIISVEQVGSEATFAPDAVKVAR